MNIKPDSQLSLSPISINKDKIRLLRSKLHNSATIEWLAKRYTNVASTKYLVLPEELQKHKEIMSIFEQFDEDKSGKLSIGELYVMMHKAQIGMEKKDLEDICKTVDLDHDHALNLKEFKHCALSEEADEEFKRIIQRLRNNYKKQKEFEENGKKTKLQEPKQENFKHELIHGNNSFVGNGSGNGYNDEKDNHSNDNEKTKRPFFPGSFGALLNYITYKNKRKFLYEAIKDPQIPLPDRLNKLKELLETQIQAESYVKKEFTYQKIYKESDNNISKATLNIHSPENSPKNMNKNTLPRLYTLDDDQVVDDTIKINKDYKINKGDNENDKDIKVDIMMNRDIEEHMNLFEIQGTEYGSRNGIRYNTNMRQDSGRVTSEEVPKDGTKSIKIRKSMNKPRTSTNHNFKRSYKSLNSPEKEVKSISMHAKKLDNDLIDTKEMLKIQEIINRAPVNPINIQNNNANFLDESIKFKVIDHLKKNRIIFTSEGAHPQSQTLAQIQDQDQDQYQYQYIQNDNLLMKLNHWNSTLYESKDLDLMKRNLEKFHKKSIDKHEKLAHQQHHKLNNSTRSRIINNSINNSKHKDSHIIDEQDILNNQVRNIANNINNIKQIENVKTENDFMSTNNSNPMRFTLTARETISTRDPINMKDTIANAIFNSKESAKTRDGINLKEKHFSQGNTMQIKYTGSISHKLQILEQNKIMNIPGDVKPSILPKHYKPYGVLQSDGQIKRIATTKSTNAVRKRSKARDIIPDYAKSLYIEASQYPNLTKNNMMKSRFHSTNNINNNNDISCDAVTSRYQLKEYQDKFSEKVLEPQDIQKNNTKYELNCKSIINDRSSVNSNSPLKTKRQDNTSNFRLNSIKKIQIRFPFFENK